MTIYKPYTYLIGWSNLNKWYYGVRYANKCDSNELWKTYFTSSKYVKNFRKQYGEPDIVQIRKIFDNEIKAQNWETKVLKRLKVISNEKWLNKTNNKAIDKSVKRNTLPGSIAAAKKRKGKTNIEYYGVEKAEEISKQISSRLKNYWKNEELRNRMSKKPENTINYKKAALKRWKNNDKQKLKHSISLKEKWENNYDNMYEIVKRASKIGSKVAKLKLSKKIEYKGKIYNGWKEFKKQTGISRYKYLKMFD